MIFRIKAKMTYLRSHFVPVGLQAVEFKHAGWSLWREIRERAFVKKKRERDFFSAASLYVLSLSPWDMRADALISGCSE